VPRSSGYHIADAESRAWSGEGCDRPMVAPDWRSRYSTEYPYAVYEPGRVYCLAWPMKNHAHIDLRGCDNNHAKSDSGHDESLALFISDVNMTHDPSQSELFMRNINELAGLATGCRHHGLSDECQLGLEKHQNGQADCKGFQRSPKFCENTGEAMGTGCFKVPDNLAQGHYVAQWYWHATFSGRGAFPYSSCFDFEVVPAGSSKASPGAPGTIGTADTTHFACHNNVAKFSVSHSTPSPAVTPVATMVATSTTSVTTLAPTSARSCIAPWEHCAAPGWASAKCCTLGHECTYSNEHWARCQPASSTPSTAMASAVPSATMASSASTSIATTTATRAQVEECAASWEHCADPSWPIPKCCTSGYSCIFANEQWARCEPTRKKKHSFLSVDHALTQEGTEASRGIGAAPLLASLDGSSEL